MTNKKPQVPPKLNAPTVIQRIPGGEARKLPTAYPPFAVHPQDYLYPYGVYEGGDSVTPYVAPKKEG